MLATCPQLLDDEEKKPNKASFFSSCVFVCVKPKREKISSTKSKRNKKHVHLCRCRTFKNAKGKKKGKKIVFFVLSPTLKLSFFHFLFPTLSFFLVTQALPKN